MFSPPSAPTMCHKRDPQHLGPFDCFYAPAPVAFPTPPALYFASVESLDLEACATASAIHGLSLDEANDVSGLMLTPHQDAFTGDWELLEGVSWIHEAATTSPMSQVAAAAPSQNRSPHREATHEQAARRRAHRRSLQQGYERDYRERKRQFREDMRHEWFALECKLQAAMVKAQGNASAIMKRSRSGPRKRVNPTDCLELVAEAHGLRMEQLVLQCMLRRERRLVEAQAFFTQPEMREKLNALSASPSMLEFQFSW